jgi:hypothetical protein
MGGQYWKFNSAQKFRKFMNKPTKKEVLASNGEGPKQENGQDPGVVIPRETEYNPWDLTAARNRQKKDRRVKVITNYSVASRPGKGQFFRVNPDPDYQIPSLLYLAKDDNGMDRDIYFVDWNFADEVLATEYATFFQPVNLYLAIERHKTKPYIHYVKRPHEGEKDNEWWESARYIVEVASADWIQPYTPLGGRGYDYHPRQVEIPDPDWPETPFGEILQIAFRGRFIDSWEHEIMKDLQGK